MLRFVLPLMLAVTSLTGTAALGRDAVLASDPVDLSVTVYRDPNRGEGENMTRNWPKGFAMISETRDVTLPLGESTIRFEGVAEGMVAVSAIVTGLPGGTIEKNRNADLLSPAALVDGTLGNRVTITRTNPATGRRVSQSAIVSSRADGGLVLQTPDGFEAVRCSGLPEKLSFDRIPAGLSAKPVFSIDTRDDRGGTYRVTLTYLAWGFDWEAHYVATLGDAGAHQEQKLKLLSWLTILNDNNQSFADATLLAVAGKLNVTSDFRRLSDPPSGEPLRLVCFPLGSTAAGMPIDNPFAYLPSPPAPLADMQSEEIMVTGQRLQFKAMSAPAALTAVEEELGDLKLYRVPERMTVAAKGMKQVAFLQRDDVDGNFLYTATCDAFNKGGDPQAAGMMFVTKNDKKHGLGVALPMGGLTIFEPSSAGEMLVGEKSLRDYASGQDVEIELGESTQIFAQCKRLTGSPPGEEPRKWSEMQSLVSNPNTHSITIRIGLGWSAQWEVGPVRGHRVKDGTHVIETVVPAGTTRVVKWKIRPANDQ